MLTEIQKLFEDEVSAEWSSEMQAWGEKVALYRKYLLGEHEVYLTETQQKMLNVTGKKHATFSADYTDMVVRMFGERLVVEQITAIPPQKTDNAGDVPTDEDEDDPAQEWVDRLLKKNRFDALQADTHETAPGEGDAFVIVDFDKERQCARMNYNEAFDGDVGVIPIYSRRDSSKMLAAAKVFYIGREKKQVNIYYADRIEKYQSDETGMSLTQMGPPEKWLGGFPVYQFANRKKRGRSTGISELQKMISLQDILNRVLVSMTMASEFSGFQVLFALGFEPPAQVLPGDVIYYKGVASEDRENVDLKALTQGTLTAYIEQINKLIDLIADITQTPIASVLGSSPSGEALKQRETWLLTKIRGAHIKFGNVWEDVLMACHRVEMAYKATGKPPAIEMFDCVWRDASVRADGDVIQQAGMVFDKVQNKELYLEMVSAVTGWDALKIREILDAEARLSAERMAGLNLFGNVGDFSQSLNGVVPAA